MVGAGAGGGEAGLEVGAAAGAVAGAAAGVVIGAADWVVDVDDGLCGGPGCILQTSTYCWAPNCGYCWKYPAGGAPYGTIEGVPMYGELAYGDARCDGGC